MNNYIWSRSYWAFFHILTMNINFNKLKKNENVVFLKKIIYYFIDNIPCDTCRIDSSQYIDNNKFKYIKNKNEFILFFYRFHNYVNTKLRKGLFNIKYLNTYINKNLQNHLLIIDKSIFKNNMPKSVYSFSAYITS